ncbi:acetylornithine aminotransferase [Kordiimonas sediminis]|uniref:Acetylornithine aminotransferase n=1 Tax=Kordiimonas sediminis TaxID=1735581 RepID=A0A919AJN4_9PROT|nr:aspartate aminotransferase family protein [Kordiimonas sediminis]GHF12905.1 acetylornithine aminotransferase [Kordiimonas sediminis]
MSSNPESAMLPTYRRMPVAFERGEGMRLFDGDGKSYLDFYSGIGVMCLGHSHPTLVNALKNQAEKLWHVSNLYQIPEGERLAARLADVTFADYVFFTNSGAESIECAIKMVRKYHNDKGDKGKYRMVTMASAFHGRTLAGIAAAGQEKLTKGFEPLPDGFDVVPFGDLDAVKAAIGPNTGAIMVETVQGEGGIRPLPVETLRALRQICDDHGLLLVFDEIQCGMGRTGKLFAYEWADITPDIVTCAKGIGGGFPMGACLATKEAASGMTAGTHGTTYGGNPLAMAVGNAVLDEMLKPGFLDHVQEMSSLLLGRLGALQQRYPDMIAEVRGTGLMVGIRTPDIEPRLAVPDLVSRGLCAAPAGENVIRMLPPLILTETDIDDAMEILDKAFADWQSNGAPTG